MENRRKRMVWAALTLTAVMLLPGCLSGTDGFSCGAGTVEDGDECVVDGEDAIPAGSKVFAVEAKQFAFEPNYLEVNEGDHVVITFTSTMDLQNQYLLHSFNMNSYDLYLDLPVGETRTLEFDATIPGEHTFECSIFCGDDHLNMVATLNVIPAGGGAAIAVPKIGNHTALTVTTELYDAAGAIVTTPSWTDNGDLMIVIERESESVAIVDTSVDRVVGRIKGLGFQPHTVVYDEEARHGYLISRGGWLSKIDLNDLSVPGYVKIGDSSRGTALSSNGRYILAGNYDPSSFVIVNTSTMEVEMEYRIPVPFVDGAPTFSRVAALLDTPNGYVFAAMKDLGEIWVIDTNESRWPVGESPFPIVKVFNGQGGLLHDAFITPDGQYYVLASQTSHHMAIIDVYNLTEVGLIDTGLKPHPGPGAVWGDYVFTPSIGEGVLNIINTSSWLTEFRVEVGGPALFTRTFEFGHPSTHAVWERNPDNLQYPYVWWDTVLSTDAEQNKEHYAIDLTLLYDPATTNESLVNAVHVMKWDDCGGRTLHPEFSHDGTKVYISCWATPENGGGLVVYEAMPDSGQATLNGSANDPAVFDVIGFIGGGDVANLWVSEPTGTFGVGLRAHEIGV